MVGVVVGSSSYKPCAFSKSDFSLAYPRNRFCDGSWRCRFASRGCGWCDLPLKFLYLGSACYLFLFRMLEFL
jgi:hypothetical protein